MGYIVGWNTPGYLPDTDEEPHVFDTAEAAKQCLIDDMLHHADFSDQIGDHALASQLSNAAEDLNLTDVAGGFGAHICNPEYDNDLGTVYWIEPHYPEEV